MKFLYICVILLSISACFLFYKSINRNNRVQDISFKSLALKNHILGESDNRQIKIYLPPSYYKTDKRYPCIYFLHGFTSSYLQFDEWKFKELCDAAIESGKIGEFILIMPDSDNSFLGSFYAGVWSKYIAEDVVPLIDSLYRTIPNIKSRGIAGNSMGGNGALKIALEYPNLFNSIYAMSPSVLDWDKDFTLENPSFGLVQNAKEKDEVIGDFYSSVIVAMGRSYTPNPDSKTFGTDLPMVLKSGKLVIDTLILEKWNKEFPIQQIKNNKKAFKNIQSIKIDWGNQDPFKHIPSTCETLCKLLTQRGINHECNMYEGDHASGLPGKDGKIANEMMVFFQKTLEFQP